MLYKLYYEPKIVHNCQKLLNQAGLLDPCYKLFDTEIQISASDGKFGPNTEFSMRIAGIADTDAILERLTNLPEIKMDFDSYLAEVIVKHMLDDGYYLSTIPGSFNIVYIEGVSYDKDKNSISLNDNEIDRWNDIRLLLAYKEGVWTISPSHVWAATTGPGLYYTEHPMNPNGAARIKFGQYKAWGMGYHNGHQPALQQNGPIIVHRDLDKNGSREGDQVYPVHYTINQHSTKNLKLYPKVGKWSAGCLVGQDYAGHLAFLSALKNDPRYKNTASYQFITTVIDGKKLV